MKKLSEEQIKKKLTELLERFDRICRENDIPYTLSYGTLLGAARHKGFIPWDDDLDVSMLQEDYERFINLDIFKNQDLNSNTVLYDVDNDAGHTCSYLLPYAKLVDGTTYISSKVFRDVGGLWIDIFPVMTLPQDKKETMKLFKKIDVLHARLSAAHRYRKLSQCSPIVFLKQLRCNFYFVFYKKIIKKMKYLAYKKPYKKGTMAANVVWTAGSCEIVPLRMYQEFTELEFEGRKYPVIKDYDKMLTKIYGDWRKFPPVEERHGIHYYSTYEK